MNQEQPAVGKLTKESSQEPHNPFALAGAGGGPVAERTSLDAMISRQAQEVQAAMVIAKKFPRDEAKAFNKVITACKRVSLADRAIYSYPKGGGNVSGPSIRLAEAIAQAWGNLDFGIIELEQKEGHSEVMSYCWDLETNTRQQKVFTVNHSIKLRGGVMKTLDDPREIYEMVANQGARRLRSCILGIIPGDVVEAAMDQCDKTLSDAEKEVPLIDRIRKMLPAFEEIGVSSAMIEKRFNKKLERLNEQELSMLRKIFTSIRDGFGKIGDHFDSAAETPADLRTETAPKEAASKTSRAARTTKPAVDKTDDVPMDSPNPPANPPADENKFVNTDPHTTLSAMLSATQYSESELLETLVRRFRGPTAKTLAEIPGDYINKTIIPMWEGVMGAMRNERALR